jgi:hypothetical protein
VVLALALGTGLLGRLGWFIAAPAVARLAVASTFSFLFPSAGVQALASARTLARYRERISTHEARSPERSSGSDEATRNGGITPVEARHRPRSQNQ